ncbi:putative quinol monooxygenase [Erwinia psidii]|uniref:Antibiotic biosynthesis monooxygenase n=1 Tax=Erwinia psidii TaxID=69224 RepID=A0A3N6TW67_9GAMM|nr:putative quinol monooxygenase [Erwinia psidii]MCX8957663.1 antibiotic biosynthesis monooxygenase [Erwinia psidii]MCX8960718.1 antibiotic biosynthesis monooxygenase [Erwinia psidii]MCX8964037.1 antibiotic biosynthesis monooxygenase [Erwinia psidii]RQM39522.1 antibiotic biosynthesis monooxygenase [Erwinia psidii]
MSYHVVVKFIVPVERRNDFIMAGLDDAQQSLENEPGTLDFNIIEDEEDRSVIYFQEVYKSKDAFEEHCRGKAFKTFFDAISAYCADPEFLFKGERVAWSRPTVNGDTK